MERAVRSLSALVVFALGAALSSDAARAGIFNPRFDGGAPAVEASSLAPFGRRGGATIKGHLSLPDVGYGQQITLSNEPVYAVPAIPYAQWYFMTYLTKSIKVGANAFPYDGGDRRKVDLFDPAVFKYVRVARTDQAGRYEFDGLPTGRWYLIALPEVDYNGTVATSGFLGGISVSDFTQRVVVLMGDEPGYDLIGNGPQTSHLVRIVPDERARMTCTDRRFHGVDCQQAFDFDQFWGARSEY